MRRFNCTGGAGRASRDRNTFEIQGNHHRLAVDVVEVNLRSIGHARRTIAVHPGFLYLREDSLLQPVAHCSHLVVVAAVQRFLRQLCSLTQTDNSGDILRAGAARALVPATVKERLKASSLPDIKRSHALRRMNLMA